MAGHDSLDQAASQSKVCDATPQHYDTEDATHLMHNIKTIIASTWFVACVLGSGQPRHKASSNWVHSRLRTHGSWKEDGGEVAGKYINCVSLM